MNKHEQKRDATIRKLKTAFWELYKEKEITKITVMDVTSAAKVYRSTFYLYFKDVYHVLECIEDDIIRYFKDNVIQIAPIKSVDNLIHAFSAFYAEKGEYVYVLTGAGGDPKFINKMNDMIVPELYHFNIISPEDPISEVKINFLTYGILAAFAAWYPKRKVISSEEVIRYIMSFTYIV